MAEIKKRKSFAGVGCLFEFLGLCFFITGFVFILTVIAPMILWPLAIFLFIYGVMKSYWFECSECGTEIKRKNIKICPGCKNEFSGIKKNKEGISLLLVMVVIVVLSASIWYINETVDINNRMKIINTTAESHP